VTRVQVDNTEQGGEVFHRAAIDVLLVLNTCCNFRTASAILTRFERAGVAQLVEHLICNQRVGGSIPSASSTKRFQGRGGANPRRKINGLVSLDTSPICVLLWTVLLSLRCSGPRLGSNKMLWRDTIFASRMFFPGRGNSAPGEFPGRVGEWLKPADCKSAAPCGLRRFESSPVHQQFAVRLENRRAIALATFDSGLIDGSRAGR
jgi:hypothetical protein